MLLSEFCNFVKLSEAFKYILTEDRISFLYDKNKEKLKTRFKDDQRVPAQYKAKLNNGDVAKNLITHFQEIDPSRKKIYVQWMIKMYLAGTMLEDLDKLKEALSTFDAAKRQLAQKDIMQYKSVNDLLKAVKPYAGVDERSKGKIKSSEIDYIINTPNFKISIPKTHKASQILGKGTEWCTAGGTCDYFDQYSGQGPLYVIEAGSGKNVKKFQFHYESDSFMDSDDDEITEADINYLSKFPQYKDFLNQQIKEKYSQYFDK